MGRLVRELLLTGKLIASLGEAWSVSLSLSLVVIPGCNGFLFPVPAAHPHQTQ